MRRIVWWMPCLLLSILSIGLTGSPPRAAGQTSQSNVLEPFLNVTAQAGLQTRHRTQQSEADRGYLVSGQAWADYDQDGWVDLYLAGALYRNNRDSTFAPSPLTSQVSLPNHLIRGASWADYDNDGWPDLYVLAEGANLLYHNQQGQSFVEVTVQAGVGDPGHGVAATWGDYDQDGYLDLYVVNGACVPACADRPDPALLADRLYRNNGNGVFSDVSQQLSAEKLRGAGVSAAFVDYDNDSDVDLLVLNHELENATGNVLWRNDGPGCAGWCWREVAAVSGVDNKLASLGLAVGDYDADLDLDFYLSNLGNSMRLLQNESGKRFHDRTTAAGVESGGSDLAGWGTLFFDYDNDGGQDLYLSTTAFLSATVASGSPGNSPGKLAPHHSYLLRNLGNGKFTNAAPASWQQQPNPSLGVAAADYDNDGWVDLLVSNGEQGHTLLRNQGLTGRGNHWLGVRLSGSGPINRAGVGTRVYVLDSTGRVQMQSVVNGGGLGANHDLTLHFGLRQARVKHVTVIWPNGEISLHRDVPVDQVWRVEYGGEGATTN